MMEETKTSKETTPPTPKGMEKTVFKSFIVPIAYMNLDIEDYIRLGDNKEIEIYSNLPGNEGSVMVRLTGELKKESKETPKIK